MWVTFNGEIYNYLELRESLKNKGHKLREAGEETEVLCHLWEEYGERMVDHLVGMFAFALFDTSKNLLYLARDRFGKKPFYYYHASGHFFFASELQALAQADMFPHGETDETAAAQYFRYGYIPSPNTIYRGVKSLRPGHYAVYREGKLNVREYWRPSVVGERGHANLDRLEEVLDEAVALRIRADVPVGAFLSGGIDLSLVVASMARQINRPVETFTITTDEAWCDESVAAAETAGYLGTNHHTFHVEPDLVKVAQSLAWHYGQPFADYSAVPTYYVCRETRRHVTVALSGDGGDELFAGYRRYANFRWTSIAARLPYSARVAVAAVFVPARTYGPIFAGGSPTSS